MRRWALLGAQRGPLWFVRFAPVVIGVLFFLLLGRSRRQVRANLRRVHGPRGLGAELWDTCRTFAQFAHCLTEGLAQGRRDVHPELTVTGGEVFEQIRAAGSGAILATAHLGPWDGAAWQLHKQFDAAVVLVMARETEDASARVQDEEREAAGLRVLRLGTDPLDALPLLDHLLGGGLAAIQLDRVPEAREGLLGELFGKPFPVPIGPFRLAGLAGVPVVPVFVLRLGFFRREVIVGRPLRLSRRPGKQELAAGVGGVLLQMESCIRRAPTQWFHFVSPEDEVRQIQALLPEEDDAEQTARTGALGPHLAKAPP